MTEHVSHASFPQFLRAVRPGPTESRGEIGRQLGARLADVPKEPLPQQLELRLKLLSAVEQRRQDRAPGS